MYKDLLKLLPAASVSFDEPMSNHTTFKIGGPADVLVTPHSIYELTTTLEYCLARQVPWMVIGAGSNLLVRDKGIRGVVIQISQLNSIQIYDEQVYAEAGARLSEVANTAAAFNLTGLEFAEGIPGSLGGAVVMNAGAYDGEMADVLLEVEAIGPSGERKTFRPNQMNLGYRQSIFQHNTYIVVAARLGLKTGEEQDIIAKMKDYSDRRWEKQPLEYPSAGSVFRRPPGHFVGPMIEALGLKGYSIGGAQVSAKHAGFIINTGGATAGDVLQLIATVQEKVADHYGIHLHTEIRIVGEP
ncbi:MAG: UDP-N-acetylmuramate dehydrogenase [Syntrophomonadaceae bacterium]